MAIATTEVQSFPIPLSWDARHERYNEEDIRPGVEFYLVISSHLQGASFFGAGRQVQYFRTPRRTNLSGEIRIEGWLGTNNDWHNEALGKWRVVKVWKNRFRAERVA
jgi:hypothetical protein